MHRCWVTIPEHRELGRIRDDRVPEAETLLTELLMELRPDSLLVDIVLGCTELREDGN